MITLDEILKLRELEAKASPKPWFVDEAFGVCYGDPDNPKEQYAVELPDDDDLSVTLRNSAPDLIEIAIWAIEAKDLLEFYEDNGHFENSIKAKAHLQKFPKGSKR